MKTTLDLYTDYLLSSFGLTTATGLSSMVDQALSHDDVTRFIRDMDYQRYGFRQPGFMATGKTISSSA